ATGSAGRAGARFKRNVVSHLRQAESFGRALELTTSAALSRRTGFARPPTRSHAVSACHAERSEASHGRGILRARPRADNVRRALAANGLRSPSDEITRCLRLSC